MNWIKENKFLFGFLVVIVVGVAALTWFVLGAKGRYDEALGTYQRRVGELNRLQKLPTFPNQKNLDKIVSQQTDVNEEVSKLASTLAAQQIASEDLSPEMFQDRLKSAVTGVTSKATQSSPRVELPKPKFFLGFDRYETAPPPKEASPALGRELKAIEWVCHQLIESRVAEIKRIEREDLPEEKGRVRTLGRKPAAPPPAKPAGGKAAPGKGAQPDKEVKHEVERHRIDLVFITEQGRLRKILNAVVGYKGQFFIPRLINVKNEKIAAPQRGVPTPAAEAPPAPDAAAPAAAPAADAAAQPAAAAPPPAGSTNYIVGEEKVEVTLVLEMVDFTEETAPATGAPPAK